jgi:hypothetical protein
MEDVGTFYDHLVHFAAIWYILWPFGIFYSHLVYAFYVHLFLVARKNTLHESCLFPA